MGGLPVKYTQKAQPTISYHYTRIQVTHIHDSKKKGLHGWNVTFFFPGNCATVLIFQVSSKLTNIPIHSLAFHTELHRSVNRSVLGIAIDWLYIPRVQELRLRTNLWQLTEHGQEILRGPWSHRQFISSITPTLASLSSQNLLFIFQTLPLGNIGAWDVALLACSHWPSKPPVSFICTNDVHEVSLLET